MAEIEPENLIKITGGEEQYNKIISETKYVIADFNANWCPPCKKLKPLIKELAKKNPTVKFFDIDVDQNKELAGKFKIASIPTMLLYVDGAKKKDFVGYDPKYFTVDIPKEIPDFKNE